MKIRPHPDKVINEDFLKKSAKNIYKFISMACENKEVPLKILPSKDIDHTYDKIYDLFAPHEKDYSEKEVYEILVFSESLTSYLEAAIAKSFDALFKTNSHADLLSFCLCNDYLTMLIDDPSPIKNHKKYFLDVLTISGIYNLSHMMKLSEDYHKIVSENDIPSDFNPVENINPTTLKTILELQYIKEDMLKIAIDSYTYFILANGIKKQNNKTTQSPFSTAFFQENIDAIRRDLNSQGGRTTHPRKAELFKIAEDTWKEYPKIPVAKLAEALLNYDKQKYNDSPSLRTITEWLKVSSYNPKLKGRQPKIEFDLVIK